MNALLIIVLICSVSIPRDECSEANARAFKASIEQGAVCGVSPFSQIAGSAIKPNENEYLIVKCGLK